MVSRPLPPLRDAARAHRREPTLSEHLLWGKLRGRALDGRKFRRQQPMGRYILDFYCEDEALAVEVDGSIHDDAQEADAARQAEIEQVGVRFVRIPARLIERNPAAALPLIRAAFRNGGSPGLPSPAHGRGAGGEA